MYLDQGFIAATMTLLIALLHEQCGTASVPHACGGGTTLWSQFVLWIRGIPKDFKRSMVESISALKPWGDCGEFVSCFFAIRALELWNKSSSEIDQFQVLGHNAFAPAVTSTFYSIVYPKSPLLIPRYCGKNIGPTYKWRGIHRCKVCPFDLLRYMPWGNRVMGIPGLEPGSRCKLQIYGVQKASGIFFH